MINTEDVFKAIEVVRGILNDPFADNELKLAAANIVIDLAMISMMEEPGEGDK